MIGDVNKKMYSLSLYQPSIDILNYTKSVRDDYSEGVRILNHPWVELNYRSIIEDENRGKNMMNAFVDTNVEDPNEAWKWRGTRSMARNKGIAMHANLTANFLLPIFLAQNEDDEVDKDFSEVMRDIIEWMASPTNSNYQSSFLQLVFSMEQNPVTFLGAEFCEVYQKIKEKQESGEYTTKEILDEVLSGFQAPLYSPSQILITNAYERNIQKQRRIIKRRYCEKAEMEAKYGDHPNWSLVQEGVRSIYNSEDGLFYDVKDDDHPHLVAEETALCRREDSEVCFINGIYFGDTDIENNPIKHRDYRNAPKYNVIPFGFHRIGEHFFYYKSMMNALGWDNSLYDTLSEIVMNRSILEVDMPIAISGSEKIDSEVIFPKAVVTFEDKDAKVQQLLPNSNLVAGFNALRETEKSMSEGSVNETISGNLPEASQKAFSVAQAQANSKKIIGGIGKSLAESVVMYGDLMKDIALNHITTAQVEEIVGEGMKLKYNSLLLENKTGKSDSRTIKFDDNLIGKSLTKNEKELRDVGIYEKHGEGMRMVNPEMFAKFKYLTKVDVEEMFAKNNDFWQPILLSLKQALMNDPYVKQDVLTKKLLYSYFQSGADEMIQEAQERQLGLPIKSTIIDKSVPSIAGNVVQ